MDERLTDERLQDLLLVVRDFDDEFEDAEFIFTEWRTDIVAALMELADRRDDDREVEIIKKLGG